MVYNGIMRQIALWATKGGVGKSTVTAGLANALRDLGLRVGAMDLDITSTGLHKAFSLPGDLRVGLRTSSSSTTPIERDGIKLYCLAWRLTEDSCVGWREEGSERVIMGERRTIPGRKDFLEELLTKTIDWGELDFLLYDLPPSSGTETWVFFEQTPNLYGVILLSQPSEISVVGLKKTVDFLKRQERPILGLVENMAFALCPCCNTSFYPFASDKVDLKRFCEEAKLPLLATIPQASTEQLKPYFAQLADAVVNSKPKIFKQEVFSLSSRLTRKIIKTGLGL